jgi:hypothetical protein
MEAISYFPFHSFMLSKIGKKARPFSDKLSALVRGTRNNLFYLGGNLQYLFLYCNTPMQQTVTLVNLL